MDEVDPSLLEDMVARALDEMPTGFREPLDNVAIIVRDNARPRDTRGPA